MTDDVAEVIASLRAIVDRLETQTSTETGFSGSLAASTSEPLPDSLETTSAVSGPEIAAASLARWTDDPVAMVRELFAAEPDEWQRDVLNDLRHQRVALQGSKGVGKSTVLAWAVWWFLLTRIRSKVPIVSVSGDALADTLWVELAVWYAKAPVLQATFDMTKTRISAKAAPDTWFASARTWPRSADGQEQAATLSGLHAERILFILDEAGSMPPVILASAEAALSACVEGKILIAGNPTDLDGALHQACVDDAKHWAVHRVSGDPDDTRRAPRVDVAWARKQIELYGRNSPWVLVNVFGCFPASSLNALIGPDELRHAMTRQWRAEDFEHYEKRLGVDVASTGGDATVIFARQGPVAFPPITLRNEPGHQIAGRIAHVVRGWGGDARIFIDNTGGYGAAVIEQCQMLGLAVIPVGFAEKAQDARYLNRRAEMAFRCADAIRKVLRLPPDCPELLLFAKIQFHFVGDKMALESKDDIRARIGQSPDHIDALMLTYALREASQMPSVYAVPQPPGEWSRYEQSYRIATGSEGISGREADSAIGMRAGVGPGAERVRSAAATAAGGWDVWGGRMSVGGDRTPSLVWRGIGRPDGWGQR